MRRTAVVVVMLWTAAFVDATECVGKKPSAGFLWIVFGCDRVRSGDVLWFTPKGVLRDQIPVSTQDVMVAPPRLGAIKPVDVPMTFDRGGDCVTGTPLTSGGHCVARYDLPCAARLYKLGVELDPQPQQSTYSVLRSVRRREAKVRCDRPNRVEDSSTIYSDSERITVSVFLEKPERQLLFQTDVHLDRVAQTWTQVWDVRQQETRLQSDAYGQGHGAVSENARWVAAATTDQVSHVKIKVERVE